jgi:hypothetical protein
MSRYSISPSLRLYALMTLGVIGVWVFFMMVGLIQWETSRQRPGNESLIIARDGQPLIDAYATSGGSYRELPARTLGGEEVASGSFERATAVNLPYQTPPRRFTDGPITWTERMLFAEYQGRWFLVRDGSSNGRAYLVAYDAETKLPLKYAGRRGFSVRPPSRDQYFDVGPPFNYHSRRVAGLAFSGDMHYGNYEDFDPMGSTPRSCLYVLDGEQLVELNLNLGKVQGLGDFPGALGLVIAERPEPLDAPAPSSLDAKPPEANRSTVDRKRDSALIVRMPTSLITLDPRTQQRTEYPLPAEYQEEDLNVYVVDGGGLVLDHMTRRDAETVHHLTWLDAAGKVQQTEEAAVASYEEPDSWSQAIALALLLPAPAFFGGMMLWAFPRMRTYSQPDATYLASLQEAFAAIWPVALTLVAISLVIAALVYRWQRENNRPRPVAWAVAAFLLGVPGFIAYLILYGRPSVARARTRKIAKTEPKLLGIEIFA